jgi:HAE1 family hydrophobic/amphiphilic exporter-1
MEEIARRTLPPGTGFEWSAMSYQERLVGNQMYIVFGLALLLVYLVLAGQYESWDAPLAVILAVPLAFIGPVAALSLLVQSGLSNNLYVQIGLVLLMALSAKNAILIVEIARAMRAQGAPIAQAAVEGARARFRPILMTSFAFILGVLPLVLASGAGAGARQSIGITEHRHDRIDLSRGAVRAVLLRSGAAVRGMAQARPRAAREAGGRRARGHHRGP